jgi:hypothetical protein
MYAVTGAVLKHDVGPRLTDQRVNAGSAAANCIAIPAIDLCSRRPASILGGQHVDIDS